MSPVTLARIVALLFLLPAFAGCLGGDEPSAPAPESPVAANAEEAGAKSGEAPVAPKAAYAVDGERTAYPVEVATNAARAPVTVDFSGEFGPSDCRPLNFGPFEGVLATASHPRRFRALDDALQVGDVFSYNITLTYTNAPDNWAEIHPAYGLGNTIQEHSESTQEMAEVVISYSGQGFRASEEDMAWMFVGCFFGAMQRPIPYTYTATFSFAEGAVPAEAPVLLSVPEGATKLFVRGVRIDETQGVLSHFRIFRPDDTLLCECALSSAEEVTTVDLPEPGDYVVIVDHTDNGFVSFALDTPTDTPLRALGAEWVETLVYTSEGGAVSETVELMLDRVPLVMFAQVLAEDAGAGKRTTLSITNVRGEPLRISWGGHITWQDPVTQGTAWLGFWPGDWEFTQDHHAYAQGQHVAEITSEGLRGDIILVTRQYVR